MGLFLQAIWQQDSQNILENEGQKGTVIFNQRICGDIDLEIGKLICIHPPWYALRTFNLITWLILKMKSGISKTNTID